MNSSSNYVLDDIYVLNVKKYVERRQFMEAQLLKEELQAEFIFDWDIDDVQHIFLHSIRIYHRVRN